MNSYKNIFLIDNDRDDQQFFIEALDGIENVSLFGTASTCIEALNILKSSSSLPDYIFIDYNMPLMNGIDCFNEIVKNPALKDIPVIMLSSALEQAEPAYKYGVKGFIKKTPYISKLKTELNQIINGSITVNYIITDETNSLRTHEKKSNK